MLSDGCIAAGKGLPSKLMRCDDSGEIDFGGGYFYVLWTGEIAPCVFIPYKEGDDRINNVYAIKERDGKLVEALQGPFFKAIRDWHRIYYHDRPSEEKGNLFLPCRIRDHSEGFKKIVEETGAEPLSINTSDYLGLVSCGIMPAYNISCAACLDPIWEKALVEGRIE